MFSAIVLNAGMDLATSGSSTVAAGTSVRVASPGLLPTPQFRRYAAAEWLKREGHAAVHVTNGLSTLAELVQASFDAMLLDLDLPGLDGFQIERLVRQREHVGHRFG